MTSTEEQQNNDRFQLSLRPYADLEEFGRIANPSARIAVPAPADEPYEVDEHELTTVNSDQVTTGLPDWPIGAGMEDPFAWDPDIADQYQLTEPPQPGAEPSDRDAHVEPSPSVEQMEGNIAPAAIMAGEAVTVIGNLVANPRAKRFPSGAVVANFTIASTPRSYNQDTGRWQDGETLFLRANLWGEPAESAAQSLTKGTRVIAFGRLKSRSYEIKEGQKRTVIELEVDEIGASLQAAKVNRTRRRKGTGQPERGFGASGKEVS